MPRYFVKLITTLYTEADSLEEAYAMWEGEADFVEIEEVEDDD
jgi:hypothetical protein